MIVSKSLARSIHPNSWGFPLSHGWGGCPLGSGGAAAPGRGLLLAEDQGEHQRGDD